MPNLWIEYTANLKPEGRIPELLNRLGRYMLAFDGGEFPPGGTRIRAVEVTDWFMADGEEDYAFVHLYARIGAGRPEEQMRRCFEGVFEIAKDHFAELYARRYLALFMEVNEADPDWTWRHNNVHAKFKALAEAKAKGG
jgi:5-carboxymethyl-2-hydroxymuconate isomerase